MKLREIAHARTGDKGRIINIGVIAFDRDDYPRLVRDLTAARVREHLADLIEGEVIRYTLPNVAALNFVLERPRGSEVTRSLALDAHGKSLSFALLNLDLPE
jgi:hypothetical protein